MPKLTPAKLQTLYEQADSMDKRFFRRVMSYERLIVGDHYNQNRNNTIRDTDLYRSQNKMNRLRLVQNHISKFINVWQNSLNDLAQDVDIIPNSKGELKDKKAAELNRSVKAHIIEEIDWYSTQSTLQRDFLKGEAIVRIQWDSEAGPLVNDQQVPMIDPMTGMPQLDPETGIPLVIQTQTPSGLLNIERLESENVFRDPAGRTWNKCAWVGYRQLLERSKFRELVKNLKGDDAPDVIRDIEEIDRTLKTYRGHDGKIQAADYMGRVCVLEWYFKPSKEYPKGQYILSSESHILFQSELPDGVFPIEIVNFDDVEGTPRGESRLRQLSPIQLEINRACSQQAEHQISIGDDKLITYAGSQISEVKKLSGTRVLKVTGSQKPEILAGRAGSQFMEYILAQIAVFDTIGDIPNIDANKIANVDPYTMFSLSSNQKKKYAHYATKFERFLIRVWKKALRLHKYHVHDNALIPILSASETVNIEEYKSIEDLSFQVKLKPRTDDPESLVAQNHTLTQFLQYAGGVLSDVDAGKIAAEMPFLKSVDLDLASVAKYKRGQNMLLKLDRGEQFQISQADDPNYMLQRLDTRMSQPDYDTVSHTTREGQAVPTEYIHQLYDMTRQGYIQLIVEMEKAEMAKQAGQIPTTGALIPVQMYESEVQEDGGISTKRIKLPNDSLEWLIEALKRQGMTNASIADQAPSSQMELNNALVDDTF